MCLKKSLTNDEQYIDILNTSLNIPTTKKTNSCSLTNSTKLNILLCFTFAVLLINVIFCGGITYSYIKERKNLANIMDTIDIVFDGAPVNRSRVTDTISKIEYLLDLTSNIQNMTGIFNKIEILVDKACYILDCNDPDFYRITNKN